MGGEGLLSADDLRAALTEVLFARCGNARVEGLAKATLRNIPPQLVSSYCNTHPGWEERRRGTRLPRATRVCYWTSSPEAIRDLIKFQDMPPPAPKGSTTLQRRRIAAHDCARALPSGDLVSNVGTMQLVGEQSPLSLDSSRYVNKLVVTFNKAVVGAKEGSTLRMPRVLKDENLDFNNKAVWPWLPLANSMEALWRRELQGVVNDFMQDASQVVGASAALASALLWDCTANIPAPRARHRIVKGNPPQNAARVQNLKRLAEFWEEKGQEYREEHDALLRQHRIEAGETDNTASSETDSGYTSKFTIDSYDIKWMPHLKPEYKACLRKQEAIKSRTQEKEREARARRRQKEHDLRAKPKLVLEWVGGDHDGASTS